MIDKVSSRKSGIVIRIISP